MPIDATTSAQLLRQRRLVAAGLCSKCGRLNDGASKWLCSTCRAIRNERRKITDLARRMRRSEQGLCTECPNSVTAERTRCEECAQRLRRGTGTLSAAARVRARRRQWISAGACSRCGDPHPTARQIDRVCLPCWFALAANRTTGNAKNGPALQAMFDAQGGRCAYTGDVLVPGDNASLDHRHPVSRGGSNDLSNLQWVTKHINRMKSDLDHDVFVMLCRLVAERH